MHWNSLWATVPEMEAFWKALERGDLKTVRKLVAANPKLLRWERGDARQPLDFFATCANPTGELLQFLLSLVTDEFAAEADPVVTACRAGREDTLRALLDAGCDPNGKKVDRYETPLHVVADAGNDKLLSILLAAGADTGIESFGKVIPLEAAQKRGRAKCVELLLGHPAKHRIPFHNHRRPKDSFEIDLVKEEKAIRSLMKKGVRELLARKIEGQVTAVALLGSGYQGFVEIGFETGSFDPQKPDCGADVSFAGLARRDYPQWKKIYAVNNRVTIRYGGKKPANQTTRAMCKTMDEPFFRFFRTTLMAAMEAGDFDRLPLANDCLFGVQMFFFHLSEFWNRRGKKVASVNT
ncbi:ankyrin repeat domain-containing protein [Anatilimnocola floriformis]|uniref:ankyrin repeat domain-containing protein n=1 Tax=Anatilimnocola floriformis TaxID=2948575 RepID=UPI0020C31630|nr:ankyrin repeat domain-containing protein [Anatilimnocola floriformis]